MPMPTRCPSCRHCYALSEKYFGKTVRCRRCHSLFVVPAPKPPPQAADTSRSDLLDTQAQLPADGDDIFSNPAPSDRHGPLSMHGYQLRPLRSVTLGDFQLLRKVGAGNMGAVYLAQQRSHDRPVALKVLFRHLALQPLFVERFYQEATAMARLDHPGIVRLFGVACAEDFHCLAMEFVDGFSTAFLQGKLGGRFNLGDALFIVLRAAEALRHAHEEQIIHRDVKPSNLLISRLGRVKLTDLGLAKPMDQDVSLTDTGLAVGTPQYMAPEQSLTPKQVDQRCDIYALGTCLYEFLTGRPPFAGETAREVLRAKEQG